MSKEWNCDEARGLKAVGTSWEEIGRIFGISAFRARMRADPVYAAHRKAQINANRRNIHSLGKRDHVRHVVPEPEAPVASDNAPFMTEIGIMAYPIERVSQSDNGPRKMRISLPYVSILGTEGA